MTDRNERLKSIRERYEEPLRFEPQIRSDIAYLLALVERYEKALEIAKQQRDIWVYQNCESDNYVRTIKYKQNEAISKALKAGERE